MWLESVGLKMTPKPRATEKIVKIQMCYRAKKLPLQKFLTTRRVLEPKFNFLRLSLQTLLVPQKRSA